MEMRSSWLFCHVFHSLFLHVEESSLARLYKLGFWVEMTIARCRIWWLKDEGECIKWRSDDRMSLMAISIRTRPIEELRGQVYWTQGGLNPDTILAIMMPPRHRTWTEMLLPSPRRIRNQPPERPLTGAALIGHLQQYRRGHWGHRTQ